MNPRQFLKIGGLVLIVVGILGFIPGIIGPTPEQSIFGGAWYFDNVENGAHLVIGVVGVIAGYYLPELWQRYLTGVLGVLVVLAGLYSATISNVLLGAGLENPADTLLHLAVGAWALVAAIANYEGTSMREEREMKRAA